MSDWQLLILMWILLSFPLGVIVGKFMKGGDDER